MQLLAYFVITCFKVSAAKKIVFFEPFGTQSHKNGYMPMALELMRRGHNVSFVTFGSDPRFVAEGGHEIVLEEMELEAFSIKSGAKMGSFFELRLRGGFRQKIDQIFILSGLFDNVGSVVYGHEGLRNFVQNEKVDLVMLSLFFADGYLPLIKQWDCPYILISPFGVFNGMLSRFGLSEDYSSYPALFSSFSDRMSYFERVMNVVAGEFMRIVIVDRWLTNGEKYAKLFDIALPEDGVNGLMKNASMLFLNNHHSINYIRPLPPAIIEVGGMHLGPSKPIPSELEDFVAGSGEHGFLVFGLGSAIKVSDMPVEFQKMFLNAFARLKQRVIWKWETTAFDSIPENVKLVKWLPQQDLLGHPKIRAFLSHGGLLSIQEAVYHGVPLIGLPLGSDQDLNVAKTVRDGYARLLDWNDLSEETIYNTIQEIVNNNSYKERAHYYSTLMRDQPETPLERAIFWIEYVIRHRGAAHLQSPAKDLNRLQRNLVDVIAFLIAIALVFLLISAFITRALFRFLVRKLFAQKSSDVKSKAKRDKKQK